MSALAKGIAHVSFPGGGMFLPARSPYDRETLKEYVIHTVRVNGRVQVLVDDQRWFVHGSTSGRCAGCEHLLDAACNLAGEAGGAGYCVTCAFRPGADSVQGNGERQRQAS